MSIEVCVKRLSFVLRQRRERFWKRDRDLVLARWNHEPSSQMGITLRIVFVFTLAFWRYDREAFDAFAI